MLKIKKNCLPFCGKNMYFHGHLKPDKIAYQKNLVDSLKKHSTPTLSHFSLNKYHKKCRIPEVLHSTQLC